MYFNNDWAVIIPMANEEDSFSELISVLSPVLDLLNSGIVYFVVDNASKDQTLELCKNQSNSDSRYKTIWAPENRNVVDAYLAGYSEALKAGHQFIIEMDAGLSHDPRALPMFIRVLNEGNECAFGSRNINGGSNADSPLRRRFISSAGTVLANIFLGTSMKDMTSGFQGFRANVVKQILDYGLVSKAHFYQTEVRYLLRNSRYMEVPIHYRAPSPSVSDRAIKDSFRVFFYYIRLRLLGKSPEIKTNFHYEV